MSRMSLPMNQSELCRMTGINKATISRIVRREKNPTPEQQRAIDTAIEDWKGYRVWNDHKKYYFDGPKGTYGPYKTRLAAQKALKTTKEMAVIVKQYFRDLEEN